MAVTDIIYYKINGTSLDIVASRTSGYTPWTVTSGTPPWASSGINNITSVTIGRSNNKVAPQYCSRWFYNYSSLTSLDLSNFDTSNVTRMISMFEGCSSLTSLDLSDFDTSNVTNTERMFKGCSSLTSLDLSDFDTSNVTNTERMFYDCSSLTSLDLSSFNTSNVTNTACMFCNCRLLTGKVQINGNPSTYYSMFANTTQTIVLTGSSSMLSTLASTANNNNVYVWNLSSRPFASRDENSSSSVNLSVDITRFLSNGDAIQINVYENNSTTPLTLTWNESLIMDTNPKTFTTTIAGVDENTSVTYTIQVSDAYGTSSSRKVIVPTSYYTIDFLKGGKEISFGEKAVEDDLSKYKLLYNEPLDWSSSWSNYYEFDVDENEYVNVSGSSAPTFTGDTFYRKIESLFKCKMETAFEDMDSDEFDDFMYEVKSNTSNPDVDSSEVVTRNDLKKVLTSISPSGGGGGTTYNDLKWVDFSTPPPSYTTGSKTYTMTIPSGYEPVTNKPFEIFVSGDARAYITDRTMGVSGSTLTIYYYLYNPNSATNLQIIGSVLFAKTEREATIPYRDTIVEQQNITYTNGWTTISKSGYKLISAYAVRDDASYNIQINKRTSGIYTLFASGAGNSTQLTEFTWVKENVSRDIAPSVDMIYPVGSYYETSDTTFDPNTAWGGTWENVKREALRATGSKTVNAAQNYTLCSVTLQPNTRYIVLGNVDTDSGSNFQIMATFTATASVAVESMLAPARVTTGSGQGCTAFLSIKTFGSTCTVDLKSYGYYTTSHTERGRMIAIPLDHYSSGNVWHRTA